MKTTLTFVLVLLVLTMPDVACTQRGDHSMKGGHMANTLAKAERKDVLFISYEEARQALMKGSLPTVKTAARDLSVAAHGADQHELAGLSADLEKASDLEAARQAFAAVSDEMIAYRATRSGERPIVAYCSMEKKSWLQPAGEISNPYLDASMRKCGEIKQQ